MAPQLMLMRTSRAGVDPLGALAYAPTGRPRARRAFPVHGGADGRGERHQRAAHRRGRRRDARRAADPPPARPAVRGGAARERRLAADRRGDPGRVRDADRGEIAGRRRAEGDPAIFRRARTPISARRIARVEIYAEDKLRAAVAVQRRRRICLRRAPAGRDDAPRRAERRGRRPEPLQSLYQTALKQGLPKPVIEDFVHAFANDVDFQRVGAARRRDDRLLSPTPTNRSARRRCCSPR